jgi:hypothetical protein
VNGVRTPFERAADMQGEWLTYEQAAERLKVSPEAVRQKAIRGRWQRTIGNDKRALVRLPDGLTDAVRTPSGRANKQTVRTPSVRASDTSLINALQAHVETLKEQLAAAEVRIERQASDFAARDGERVAELAAEKAKTEKAIDAFSALADRLDALANQQRKPFLKRLKQRLVG